MFVVYTLLLQFTLDMTRYTVSHGGMKGLQLQTKEDHYGVCDQTSTECRERKCVQQVQCFRQTKGLSLHHQL